ncbi:MAG: hypothetical protein ACI8O8_003196 [Oleiphilaceae bacterium]|jgi:hypothetical protein
MNEASVDEALKIYKHHFNTKKDLNDPATDEIELF